MAIKVANPRVLLYQEMQWATLGDERWLVSTEIVKPGAMVKDEIEIDEDVQYKSWAYMTREKALEGAKVTLSRDDLAFGAVTVRRQVVDWFVREDGVAEWADVGESEEFTAGDFK